MTDKIINFITYQDMIKDNELFMQIMHNTRYNCYSFGCPLKDNFILLTQSGWIILIEFHYGGLICIIL